MTDTLLCANLGALVVLGFRIAFLLADIRDLLRDDHARNGKGRRFFL